ncbi:MAG: carbohydrate ABC transporter permease [Oscillospiraceae bacterium]|jgi:putative aldouronate transport system permease protein|nr:carbohydrate ABC transporter permease [Oscillospiraceae bacterium]
MVKNREISKETHEKILAVKATANKNRLHRTSFGDWLIVFLCVILIITCILPLLSVIAQSLSSPRAIMHREVTFWPVELHTDAYRDLIFADRRFMTSLGWTAILTVIVTIINVTMTVLCAYPLTYDKLKGRRIITIFILFTMLFNAGTIPMFVLFRNLNLINNPLVLVLPGMISVFWVIVMRKFFLGLPSSLRESAEIDGANPLRILISIYLPLSAPVLATAALMYAVGRWNGFTDALMFMQGRPEYHPIQLLLYNIINNNIGIDTTLDPGVAGNPGRSETLRGAAIVVATVPILCVYPWLQRFFVKGVTLGAVKG